MVGEMIEIEIANISPNPDQPRTHVDDDAVAHMADSIAAYGLMNPITVHQRDDGYILVAGDIRLQAHQRLGHEKILAHVIDDGNLAELALVENVQRTDLSPIDLANKVTELIDTHEYVHDDIARILGKSRANVTQLVTISRKLPEDLKKACSTSNLLPRSNLYEIASAPPAKQAALLERAQAAANGEEKLSVKSARAAKSKGTAAPDQTALKTGTRLVDQLQQLVAKNVIVSEKTRNGLSYS